MGVTRKKVVGNCWGLQPDRRLGSRCEMRGKLHPPSGHIYHVGWKTGVHSAQYAPSRESVSGLDRCSCGVVAGGHSAISVSPAPIVGRTNERLGRQVQSFSLDSWAAEPFSRVVDSPLGKEICVEAAGALTLTRSLSRCEDGSPRRTGFRPEGPQCRDR
jgi:hypothetical protein